jgi:hypothetical protein
MTMNVKRELINLAMWLESKDHPAGTMVCARAKAEIERLEGMLEHEHYTVRQLRDKLAAHTDRMIAAGLMS